MKRASLLLEHEIAQEQALLRVTAIVVSYNSAHCIPALAHGLAALPHIIVVDNGSTDSSLAAVRQHLPQAQCLELGRNLGFGAANNRGWQAANTEFVLLVNPDCVLDTQSIAALVAQADTWPDAALVAPQLLNRHAHPEINYRWASTAWISRGPGADAPACVGFVCGACMLIRREAMARIGGFDEDFFLYYEDDDLCLRLSRDAGALLLDPRIQVRHFSRGSVGGARPQAAEYLRGYHHIQSKFHFRLKHFGQAPAWLQRLGYILGAGLETLLRLLLLDTRRAARSAGRCVGAIRYRARQLSQAK